MDDELISATPLDPSPSQTSLWTLFKQFPKFEFHTPKGGAFNFADDPTLKIYLLGFCCDLGSRLEDHRLGAAAGP